MKSEEFAIVVYTDGGARGNPGEAAYGFVIIDNKKIIYKEGKRIGVATNNVAEYMGVIAALRWLNKNMNLQNKHIVFYLDSLLVASQLLETFKVKNENLRSLFFTIKELEEKMKGMVSYRAIKRENNKEADLLVNLALDNKL